MASSREVEIALNIIGTDFLSSIDKKALDDIRHEYFDPQSKHSDEFDDYATFFQTEGTPVYKNRQFSD